jgi:Mrp family chromosome partitioning ATPase/capsular polysaccharide biosynthesis protein
VTERRTALAKRTEDGPLGRGYDWRVAMTAQGPGLREGGWPDTTSQHPLGVLWRALRAHPVVAVAVLLATLAGALAWLSVRTPQYRATAQVLVNPRPQDDQLFLGLSVIKDTGDPTRTIQTAAALLASPEAARSAARSLGAGWTETEVLGAIDIQPQGESNILDVTATASTAGDAAAIANAFVRAVLDERERTLRRQVEPMIERLTQALADLRSDGDPTIELARRATLPDTPEGAPSRLILVLAFVAGAVLAAVAALLTALLEPPRVATEFQLANLTRMPVLARVPKLRRWRSRGRSRAPAPLPRASLQAFRTLRLQLELTPESAPRVVMLTSPSRGDGKTTSVVQFAQTLAAGGSSVLVVDLDVGRPQLAQALGVTPDRDLLGFAPGDGPPDSPIIEVPGHPDVTLIVATRTAAGVNVDELERPVKELLEEAREEFAYVLLDTPPLAEVGDALKFAFLADAVLLVVRLGSTTVTDLEIAGDLLERTGRPSAGCIVVGSQPA